MGKRGDRNDQNQWIKTFSAVRNVNSPIIGLFLKIGSVQSQEFPIEYPVFDWREDIGVKRALYIFLYLLQGKLFYWTEY